MKKYLILSLFLLASISTIAQPIANFKHYSYDFNTIKETDGKVSHSFEFTNIGKSDLLITEVKASCGCTTPKWSKKPIPPGKIGYITVTYNPKTRPGPFNKTITITNNSKEDKILIYIKGDVIPKENKKDKEIKK